MTVLRFSDWPENVYILSNTEQATSQIHKNVGWKGTSRGHRVLPPTQSQQVASFQTRMFDEDNTALPLKNKT